MIILIELDGAVIDVQQVYWNAYHQAAGDLGLARTDPATFWRTIRTGAPIGRALSSARPAQIEDCNARFAELIEADTTWDHCRPQPEVAQALSQLRGSAKCTLVTVGRNRAVRQKAVDAANLSIHFAQMLGLASEASRRPQQLRQLSDTENRIIVAASSPPVVRAAASADMLVAGISNGTCTALRLTQAGAQIVFGDLNELADEIQDGAERLITCGLPPETPQPAVFDSAVAKRYPRGGRRQ